MVVTEHKTTVHFIDEELECDDILISNPRTPSALSEMKDYNSFDI